MIQGISLKGYWAKGGRAAFQDAEELVTVEDVLCQLVEVRPGCAQRAQYPLT